MCPYCVPGPKGGLDYENFYPPRISLLSQPVRTASRSREDRQPKPRTVNRYPSARSDAVYYPRVLVQVKSGSDLQH